MSVIINQGQVQTTGGVIYGASTGATITNIKINNSAAYQIELHLYRKVLGTKVLMYKYDLEGGDVVNDDTIYYLTKEDYIWAKSNVANTNFIIQGSQSDEFTNNNQ